MADNRAHFIKIKIIDKGEKKINITLPLFLLTFPVSLIPNSWLNRWMDEDIDVKNIIRTIKKEGKGTRINIHDNTDEVKIFIK
ncbi:MAG: hypothetical protein ACOC4G_02195 [Bacillota bacterium]